MRHSESIKELATALAKAQGEFKPAQMDAANPFYKSRYATLSAIMEACREALSRNGLAVAQSIVEQGEKRGIETILFHASGEWIASDFDLIVNPAKNKEKDEGPNMQTLGSAVTYARRYGLSTLLGIVAEDDDDGNATVTNKSESGRPSATANAGTAFISEPQRKRLFAISNESGWTHEEVKAFLQERGIATSAEIPFRHYENIVNHIMQNKRAEA